MRRRLVLAFLSALLASTVFVPALAQTAGSTPTGVRPQITHSEPDDPTQDPQQEMLDSLKIRRAEKDHQQNLEHARESAQLSVEVRDTFNQHRTLSAAEAKKLNRVEKLARQIRSDAGGSDDDAELRERPQDLAAVLARIAELAGTLAQSVEKTPRHVVSVAIITQANELLELVKLARAMAR